MEHCSEVFVGIDVAKVRNAVAVADGGRGGEVRFVGEVDASKESMRRVVKRTRSSRHQSAIFQSAMHSAQGGRCRRRTMHDTDEYSISDLADLFSVSRPTVYRTLGRQIGQHQESAR